VVIRPWRFGSCGGIWFNANPIVHGAPKLLLTSQVPFRRLNGDMTQEKLDLLEFATREMTAFIGSDEPQGREPYNWAMGFDDYKVVLYRQDDGGWVAEIPAVGGCYALMDTREAALAELEQVFALIAKEHHDRGRALPKDTTEIVHA
jgi:predicted RNase H-like HicB family nuclease